MVNMVKFGFEAFFGSIFIFMAIQAVVTIFAPLEANVSAIAWIMIGFVDLILIAIYLYALALNSGILKGK